MPNTAFTALASVGRGDPWQPILDVLPSLTTEEDVVRTLAATQPGAPTMPRSALLSGKALPGDGRVPKSDQAGVTQENQAATSNGVAVLAGGGQADPCLAAVEAALEAAGQTAEERTGQAAFDNLVEDLKQAPLDEIKACLCVLSAALFALFICFCLPPVLMV